MTLRNFKICLMIFLISLSCRTTHNNDQHTIMPAPDNRIMLNESQIQLANINVTEVRKGSIGRQLSLPGILKTDEQSLVKISARVPGRVEKLYFKNTGERIRKGEKIYEIFSEDLIIAQKEYFTLHSNNWNFSGKYEPSLVLKDKLQVLGLMPSQITQLEKDGRILFSVTIYSPADGLIRSLNVSEGEYVEAGQPLFDLAMDNELWVEAQAYREDVQFFSTGMSAIVIIPSADEVPVLSRVSFISPAVESGRNTTLIRAVIENPDRRLHPGMFATLLVRSQTAQGLIIPSSAVLSGTDGERVWVNDSAGCFSPRMVKTGIQTRDSVMIISGLSRNDQVVTSGAYLLNSEYILKNGYSASEGSLSGNTQITKL